MHDVVKPAAVPQGEAALAEWVRDLEAHPLANMFPMIEGDTLSALRASIAAKGIIEPITIYCGQVLDGRNRRAAGLAVKHRFIPANFKDFLGTPAEAEQYVVDMNIRRRQLSDNDKKAFVVAMMAKHESLSDRRLAKLCGVSHSFVGKLRAPPGDPELEKFTKAWANLSDSQRESFVRSFTKDLTELLMDFKSTS